MKQGTDIDGWGEIMRRAGIVLATVLALTRAIVVYSWGWRDRRVASAPTSGRGQGPVAARPGTDAGADRDLPPPADRRPHRRLRLTAPKDLVAVLRWLRPGTRIAMGPAARLNRH